MTIMVITTHWNAAGIWEIAAIRRAPQSIPWDTISMNAVPMATVARIHQYLFHLQSPRAVMQHMLLFWVMASAIHMGYTIQRHVIGTLGIVVIRIVQAPIGIIPMNAAHLAMTVWTLWVDPRPASSWLVSTLTTLTTIGTCQVLILPIQTSYSGSQCTTVTMDL